jgi:hypothetical protein
MIFFTLVDPGLFVARCLHDERREISLMVVDMSGIKVVKNANLTG